jgi:hypothetical protein
MSCVICLEQCQTDIGLYRIDRSKCKCVYNVHFECIQDYCKTKKDCLMCKEKIFYIVENNATNNLSNSNNVIQENTNDQYYIRLENTTTSEESENVNTTNNTQNISDTYYFSDFCQRHKTAIGFIFIGIVLIYFYLPYLHN